MNRYNQTERLGVNAASDIVTRKLSWIFREWPIVDVGIDAIVEEVKTGNPTGKLIALQIKSGKNNFHSSQNKLTLYVSDIHRNYWLNFQFPVVLVAHLPEDEKTFWQVVSNQTLKRTKNHWKLEIPKNQELNEKSQKRLSQLFQISTDKSYLTNLYRGHIDDDNIFDFVEDAKCIGDAANCIQNIIRYIAEIGEKANAFNIQLQKFIEKNLFSDDPQVKSSIKAYGKDLNISSRRLEVELSLFTELYSKGFHAQEQLVTFYLTITSNLDALSGIQKSLSPFEETAASAISSVNKLRNVIEKLPNKYPVLKEAKLTLAEKLQSMVAEFEDSKNMALGIQTAIEKFSINPKTG